MKKQILSVILGAVLFTTHPAFGMERIHGEFEEPQKGILCRLEQVKMSEDENDVFKKLRIAILERLDRRDFLSLACTSKRDNKLISDSKITIDLHFIYKNCVHSNLKFFENVEFSLYMCEEKELILLKKLILWSGFIKGKYGVVSGEAKQEIPLFPSRGNLKFLVRGASENVRNLIIQIEDCADDLYGNKGKLEKSKIVNGSALNLTIQFDRKKQNESASGVYKLERRWSDEKKEKRYYEIHEAVKRQHLQTLNSK